MKMKFFLTAIILVLIGYFLIDGWLEILRENYVVQWQNVSAVVLFLPLPILLFRHYKAAVLGTGVYLLLGFCKLLSLTSGITTSAVTVAGLRFAGFNMLCFGLLVLYITLHFTILIEMQMDYKESKAK